MSSNGSYMDKRQGRATAYFQLFHILLRYAIDALAKAL